MTNETRALIASAIQKLGPERCQSALAAFDDPEPDGWYGCALARAYGAKGELRECAPRIEVVFLDGRRSNARDFALGARRALGLTAEEIRAVINVFDSATAETHPEERAAWDELRAMFEAEAAKCAVRRPVAGGVR